MRRMRACAWNERTKAEYAWSRRLKWSLKHPAPYEALVLLAEDGLTDALVGHLAAGLEERHASLLGQLRGAPAQRGEHRQSPLGDLDAEVLQVVHPRALDADEVVAICGVQVGGGHVARSCNRGSTVWEGTAREQLGQLPPASRWVEGGSRHRLVDRDAGRAQAVGDVVAAG